MKKVLGAPLTVVLILAMVAACGKMPDERLMEKGKKFEAKGKFVEAAASYEKLAKLYSKSPFAPEALYRAGVVYANALQKFPEAISEFKKVVQKYPESKSAAPSQFMIGFIYANSISDTAKAREAYTTFLKKYPDHELVSSVKWELAHLGKNINQIPELKNIENSSDKEKVKVER